MQPLSNTRAGREPGSPTLRIYLLGPPRVEWHGQPLAIPRRQTRALLYRLAAETQPVSRDQLCFLFWPDADDTTARHNLSRLMTILHHILPDEHVLIAREDQIELDAQAAWSDIRTFANLWTAWNRQDDQASLHAAVALYRGPFLCGFGLPDHAEFEAWMGHTQEYWTQRYLQALAALGEALAVDGDTAGAIDCLRRYLDIDELAEEMHRRLIELYALAGNRSAALQQYERCVTILERELGVDPMPATQAAYHTVLRGDTLAVAAPARSTWTTLPALDVPMVGRSAEVKALDEAWSLARAGRGGVMLIAGESGVGKTRLMQEFAGRVHSQTLVLAGCCYPETRLTPYQPIIEALRPHLNLRRLEFDTYPPWLIHLAPLFAELRPLHPDLPPAPASEPGWARTRLFEALEAFVLQLVHGKMPIVLCLDDLHWADCATLDWLAYLGRRIHGLPVLVAAAYREDEAGQLAGLRSSLMRQGVLRELVLSGLNEAAIAEILHTLSNTLLATPDLAGRLYEVTDGNPFYLLEVLLALLETGAHGEPAAAMRALPLPESVRLAVSLRVAQLSPTARQVLEAAAIVGQVVASDVVQLTAGRGESETVDALDELCARQLLVGQADRLRFRHEIVREAVDASLSPQRRRLLHQRTAEALTRIDPEDAAPLARHLAAAGRPGLAAHYALQAGLAAKRVYAHVEARIQFDRALALLALEAPELRDPTAMAGNRRRRILALSERGWVLRLLGDMDAYVRDLNEEAQLVVALDDPSMLAHLRWQQASAHLWFCRYGPAQVTAGEGQRLAHDVGDTYVEAMCWRAAGLAARELGELDQAQAALETALHLFSAPNQAALRVHTLGNLSTLAGYRGDYEQARALAQQALAICETASLWTERRIALGDLGVAAAGLGDVDLADCCLAESLDIARQVSDRTQEILSLGHLGWLAVQTGQAAVAFEHLHTALALAEQVKSCAEQSWLHAGLAEALWLAGDEETALVHARRALSLAEASGRVVDRDVAQRVLTRLACGDSAR